MYNRCLMSFFIIYSCAAVFVIVAGQSTTDDNVDDNNLYPALQQLLRTLATLQTELAKSQAKIAKLETTMDHSRK